jgi:hypothetical protein
MRHHHRRWSPRILHRASSCPLERLGADSAAAEIDLSKLWLAGSAAQRCDDFAVDARRHVRYRHRWCRAAHHLEKPLHHLVLELAEVLRGLLEDLWASGRQHGRPVASTMLSIIANI